MSIAFRRVYPMPMPWTRHSYLQSLTLIDSRNTTKLVRWRCRSVPSIWRKPLRNGVIWSALRVKADRYVEIGPWWDQENCKIFLSFLYLHIIRTSSVIYIYIILGGQKYLGRIIPWWCYSTLYVYCIFNITTKCASKCQLSLIIIFWLNSHFVSTSTRDLNDTKNYYYYYLVHTTTTYNTNN